ncbi:radical SAM protein [Rhabdobacter roseus]|uniref:MoaA/NifB/PqqE/SkfB family radical SAM enzyme n=1 Tax=Rhabdobacter roseus TaxID=1655419 RepID=A0A840TPH8_9BACT|nr:radical SAM protein [Rhabdobacter roseus]MBB5284815.1 MoaA/NifB/PqqE/SkfB family radical SAM enzyme [Rhabdobacter roseus]
MRLVSHPILCNYYLTYRCNASCGFCDIWERPSPYVTLESARENLRDLRKLGVKVVDFTGGEPLLHRQLDMLLTEAKAQGMITTVTTNGLLYPKYAERLKGLVDMLHFSLDSPDRDEHDQSRGVKCFDKVMESIAVARSLGERPDIIFTVFESNIHHIKRLWEEICLPNDLVLILNPVFEYNGVGETLSDHALKELTRWGKQKNVYLNDAFVQLRLDGGNHVDRPVCKAASTTLVISPENKLVLPCYHLGLKEFPIEGNLRSLYLSDEVQTLVALEGRLPACEGCAINCYMQPSFAVEMNKYWWKALPSTLKYNRIKGTWKQMLR